MTMSDTMFMIGDAVFYTGEKYKGKLNGKKGWIHAPVINQPGCWITEFPGTRDTKDQNDTDDYVISQRFLTHWRPSEKELKKQEGPEVQPRRRHKSAEDE